MGPCLSTEQSEKVLSKCDGDLAAYKMRYKEGRLLGEGSFGVVNLVHDKSNAKVVYACKALKKGAVWKDDVLYPPIPPEVLRTEVTILQTLNGEHFCLKLEAVYEAPDDIFMICECCAGGEMMEYVAQQPKDLRTEDISRISYQLLDAVNHCDVHNIIHRDLKPENTMFTTLDRGAELRLIDFGLSTNVVVDGVHTTYSGTPFYNSPEMFQNKYTSKTDVWSAGVTLYVLVAGYPSEALQKAFNILLDPKRKDLKGLPNMPDSMPNSYYEMLDGLLVHNWKKRKSAGDMLDQDFVRFHKDLEAEVRNQPIELPPPVESSRKLRMKRTSSFALPGTVERHSVFLDFKSYERSLTTVLATMLERTELHLLTALLDERVEEQLANPQLRVIKVWELKEIVEEEIQSSKCMTVINSMKNSSSYDNFSYHTNLCKVFDTNGTDIFGGADKGYESDRVYESERPNPRVFKKSLSSVSDSMGSRHRSMGPSMDRAKSIFL
eukprot:scaffold22589_cov138-Cylindrotheca_fusiformis.AAC.17